MDKDVTEKLRQAEEWLLNSTSSTYAQIMAAQEFVIDVARNSGDAEERKAAGDIITALVLPG